MINLRLDPAAVTRGFALVVAALTLANAVALTVYFTAGGYGDLGELFDVGIEGNIPTFYSGVALLISGALAWLHGIQARMTGDSWHHYWFGLAVVMTFLGVDDAVVIHEHFSDFFEHFMTPEGVLYYLWVVPYSLLTLVFVAVYAQFLMSLPLATARRMVVAGAVFVAGALGVEMIGAAVADALSSSSVQFSILYSVEELLEMTGVVLFIRALLLHGAPDGGLWYIDIRTGDG